MEPDEIRELGQSLGPELEGVVMTAAQKLREEGRTEGRVELLLRLIRRKFSSLPPDLEQLIRAASPEELDRFADRLMDATTIDEVLH